MASKAKSPSSLRLLRIRLNEVVLQLRHIHSSVAVAAAALRQQNCELDEDIANVLQRNIGDRIYDQLQTLESIQKFAETLQDE